MPATMEVVCTAAECPLDMVELHFTYEMPDDVAASDFSCPYCGQLNVLEEIVL